MRKLQNKVAVIPIVNGALGMVPKGLLKGLMKREMRKNRDDTDNRIVEIG